MEEKTRDSPFDWTIAVHKWSDEQLEAWSRDNTTKDTLPKSDWHYKQFAVWARKVLNFDDEDQNLLKRAKINGATLLHYEDKEDLKKSVGLSDGPARDLWAVIKKLKSLAEPRRTRTASEAGLKEKGAAKRGKYIFHILKETPDTRRVEGYAFEHREKEMEQFIELSLTNLKEVQSATPNNHKIQLAIASQMLGSGKTWFGRFLLEAARKNQEKLLTKFDQKDLEYFLSAHYVGIDLRDLEEQQFSSNTLKDLFLRCLILQCPEHKFKEAKSFWNDKDICSYGIGEMAVWFVQLLNAPLFFHFDEVDAINASLSIKQTFEPDQARIHNYYHFWSLIHPLHKYGFIYLSGRTPHLFYLGKQFHYGMERPPSNTKLFCFD